MGRKPFMKNSNGYGVDLPERGPGNSKFYNLRKWDIVETKIIDKKLVEVEIYFCGANSSIKMLKLLPRL